MPTAWSLVNPSSRTFAAAGALATEAMLAPLSVTVQRVLLPMPLIQLGMRVALKPAMNGATSVASAL